MKIIMWSISVVSLIITCFVLQLLPDKIPMHYDLNGNIDRWGDKSESLIFPIVILFVCLLWTLFIAVFEKKLKKAKTEKELIEAKSNIKILSIVGICEAVIFSIMHFVSMYSSYNEAVKGMDKAHINISNVSCFLLGVMFIVLGNVIPKSKRNSSVGIRTSWSMYNDITWRKSNFFGGIAMIVTGVLTALTSVFVSGSLSTLLLIVYLLAFTVACIVYSKLVYEQEKK